MTILHYDHKKSARIHHLWHYFIKDSKAQQAKKNAYNLFNIQFCFIFLQVCWHNSGFVVGNSQNSV